jgi:hypothetical protein
MATRTQTELGSSNAVYVINRTVSPPTAVVRIYTNLGAVEVSLTAAETTLTAQERADLGVLLNKIYAAALTREGFVG